MKICNPPQLLELNKIALEDIQSEETVFYIQKVVASKGESVPWS